jgi:hypothetical protein
MTMLRQALRAFVAAVVTAGSGCAAAGPADASPNTYSCADVGGVFLAHSDGGGGSCVPADSRPKCHIPLAEQEPYYVGELVLTPPTPTGTLQGLDITVLENATNADCWKIPQ